MRHYKTKAVAMLMSLAMVVSVAPVPKMAYAEEIEAGTEVQEVLEQAQETEQDDNKKEVSEELPNPELSEEAVGTEEVIDQTEGAEEVIDQTEEAEEVIEQDQASVDTEEESENEPEEATTAKTQAAPKGDGDENDAQHWIITLDTDRDYSDDYVFVDETILTETTNEQLHVIISNLTEKNKQILLEAIQEFYKAPLRDGSVSEYIEFINPDFVDVEKWSFKVDYNANLCWAAEASNMIWTSGWAKNVINPLTNRKFASADEIFTYFSTYFTDEGSNSKDAIQWFMDAIYTPDSVATLSHRTTEDDKYLNDNGYGTGREQNGLQADLVFELLCEEVYLSNDDMKNIEQVEQRLKDSAVGLDIAFIKEDGSNSAMGHATTAVGLITDDSKTGLDRYVAILIADSDDNPANMTVKPTDADEATEICSQQPNSYDLYYLERIVTNDGNCYWILKDYVPDRTTIITNINVLKKLETVDIADITETEGSKDPKKNVDFIGQNIKITDKNEKVTDTFVKGEDVYLGWTIGNQADQSALLPGETEGGIPHRVEIYKDGTLLESINDVVRYGVDFKLGEGIIFSANLTELFDLTAGSYVVKIYYNEEDENGNRIQEAYYKNNAPLITEFTIVDPQPVPPTPTPTPTPTPSEDSTYSDKSEKLYILAVLIDENNPEDVLYNTYILGTDHKFYFDVNTKDSLFQKISCDGEEIDSKYYTIEKISDKNFHLVMDHEYMEQLSKGEHQFDFVFENSYMPYPVKVQVK